MLSLNETGVQTDSSGRLGYTGAEVSATGAGGVTGSFATADYQASWYGKMLELLACDPNVAFVNIFHLVDEASLAGWQSGLYYADESPKKSAQTVRSWLAQTGGVCTGKVEPWTPGSLRPTPALPGTGRGNGKGGGKGHENASTGTNSHGGHGSGRAAGRGRSGRFP